MEYQDGLEWCPEEEIVDIIFKLISTSESLQSIEIESLNKSVTFHKNKDISDLRSLDNQFKSPVVCVKLGQRIDDELIDNSSKLIIKTLVVIDSSVSANLLINAELGSKRLQRKVKNFLYSKKYQGNLRILSAKGFLIDPFKNGDKNEVTWRNFIEVEYR